MESTQTRFSGFPREILDFLLELRFNNTVAQQANNLTKYKKYISEPLYLLYCELVETVLRLNLPLEIKPTRCISTPYTDRRFSPSAPLKEYMYIRFRQYGKATDIPGLYFDMGIEHYGYGIRIYKQTARGMDALREKIAASPGKYSAMLDELSAAGFCVIGEKYRKDRYPDLPGCAAKEILNRRSFYMEKAVPVGGNVFTPALSGELTAAFERLSELFVVMEEL